MVAMDDRGSYDCETCPDRVRRQRHCPYPRRNPEAWGEPDGLPTTCPVPGIDQWAANVLRLGRMTTTLTDLDRIDYASYQAMAAADGERSRIERERMERAQRLGRR